MTFLHFCEWDPIFLSVNLLSFESDSISTMLRGEEAGCPDSLLFRIALFFSDIVEVDIDFPLRRVRLFAGIGGRCFPPPWGFLLLVLMHPFRVSRGRS